MPVQDVEMASKAPIARVIPKSKRKRGAYRLPITVAVASALCWPQSMLFQ